MVKLSPHALSLNYIANNNVIQFFETAGVNLTPFYILLWKHIFVVELLCKKFGITTESACKDCLSRFRQLFSKKNHAKEQAIEYLEDWGDKFWLTTEVRMHELTDRIENNLSASLGTDLPGVDISASGARSLSSEQKKKIVRRGKEVVSKVQIRELENFIGILAEDVFDDRQEHYYLLIDMLDEQWADDRIRYKLIKALIDTVRRFRRVENVKIIVALRQDLIDKVLHSTRDPGFQEEKYESLYLYLGWTARQLRDVVEARVKYLIRRRYTKTPVSFDDLFVSTIDNKPVFEYLLDRTFYRPRDIILFVNECIAHAQGLPRITPTIIKKAERDYSYKRMQSLATEWQIIYPNLFSVMRIFSGMKSNFRVSDISRELVENHFEALTLEIDDLKCDPITLQLESLYSDGGNFESIRRYLLSVLHSIGFFGIKLDAKTSTNWVYQTRLLLSVGQIRNNSRVYIHPMFHRGLALTK